MKEYSYKINDVELSMIIFGLRCARDRSNDNYMYGSNQFKTYTELIEKISGQHLEQSE
jgi:hypothetical protein